MHPLAAIVNDESLQKECTARDTTTTSNGWKGDMSKVSLGREESCQSRKPSIGLIIMKFWFMSPFRSRLNFLYGLTHKGQQTVMDLSFLLDTRLIINHVCVRLWKLPRLWKKQHFKFTLYGVQLFRAIFIRYIVQHVSVSLLTICRDYPSI